MQYIWRREQFQKQQTKDKITDPEVCCRLWHRQRHWICINQHTQTTEWIQKTILFNRQINHVLERYLRQPQAPMDTVGRSPPAASALWLPPLSSYASLSSGGWSMPSPTPKDLSTCTSDEHILTSSLVHFRLWRRTEMRWRFPPLKSSGTRTAGGTLTHFPLESWRLVLVLRGIFYWHRWLRSNRHLSRRKQEQVVLDFIL